MAQIFKNNLAGVLATGLAPASTSMTLLDASAFPAPAAGDFYLLTLVGLNANGQEASWEVVKVTSKASNTLAVERAQEGTTAATWPAATTVQMRVTAGSLAAGLMSVADKTKLDGIAGLQDALDAKQPLDADLTAIAALAGTAGLLKKTAANTWALDTTAYTTNLGTVTGVTGTSPVVSSGGTAPVISMPAATASANGYMTSAYAAKLDGVEDGANAYTHPASHPPSIIAQDASNRFVTDAEKTAWSGKADGTHSHSFASLTGKPTTLDGYGITDVQANIAANTHSATVKATPADADELGLIDSAGSWALKKLTFASLKTWIAGLFVSRTNAQIDGGLDAHGKVRSVRAFGDGAANTGFQASAPGTAQNQRAGVSFVPTFSGTTDNTPRRAADIWASFGEAWGTERLSFGVGNGGAINDAALVTLETLALTAKGDVLAMRGVLGYGSGATGVVTQPTSKDTEVAIHKPCGRIVTSASSIPANSNRSFLVRNNSLKSFDVVNVCCIYFGDVDYSKYFVEAVVAYGADRVTPIGFYVEIYNNTSSPQAEALNIAFSIIKGSAV